jgi:CheY-like chemotaxis protein
VEDEPLVRHVIVEVLTGAGITVIEAGDGREALAAFGEVIDAALIDLRLPDISGLDLLRRFKRARPDCPMLMMSGRATPQLLQTARALGAEGFLSKPFDVGELLGAVEELVNTRVTG